jgi:hypothetical protein
MPTAVQSGPFQGHRMRRARTPKYCEYVVCKAPINSGDYYVEGDISDREPLGFVPHIICLDCACVNDPTMKGPFPSRSSA